MDAEDARDRSSLGNRDQTSLGRMAETDDHYNALVVRNLGDTTEMFIAFVQYAPVQGDCTEALCLKTEEQAHGEHATVDPSLIAFIKIAKIAQIRSHDDNSRDSVSESAVSVLKRKHFLCTPTFIEMSAPGLAVADARRADRHTDSTFDGGTIRRER